MKKQTELPVARWLRSGRAGPRRRPKKPATALEEVVVTAQKREQNIQDVPIAIDAISRDAILAQRISGSDDLLKLLPNLSLKTASAVNSGFAIRGVGTQNFHLTAQQAVGLYFDEVSQVTPFTSQLGPVRHGAHRGAARPAEHAVRAQHHRRRGQLHHAPAESRGRHERLRSSERSATSARSTAKARSVSRWANTSRCARRRRSRTATACSRRGIRRRRSAARPAIRATRPRLGAVRGHQRWLSLHYGKSDPERVPRKATGRFLADNGTTCPTTTTARIAIRRDERLLRAQQDRRAVQSVARRAGATPTTPPTTRRWWSSKARLLKVRARLRRRSRW